MGTNNFVNPFYLTGGGGSGSNELPPLPPVDDDGNPIAGFWDNNGVLTYFDGTQNRVVDFDEGELLDAFGNPRGIDI